MSGSKRTIPALILSLVWSLAGCAVADPGNGWIVDAAPSDDVVTTSDVRDAGDVRDAVAMDARDVATTDTTQRADAVDRATTVDAPRDTTAAMCPSACTMHSECASACPAAGVGYVNCCSATASASGYCFQAMGAACPATSTDSGVTPGVDASSPFDTCHSDADCTSAPNTCCTGVPFGAIVIHTCGCPGILGCSIICL